MAEQTSDFISDFQGQFQLFFQNLTTAKKIFLFSSLGGILIGLVAFVFYSQQITWSPLVSGLSPQDAGKILSKLEELNVTYVLQPGGRGILVPADNVDDIRLKIASSGLQMGGIVGWESFENLTLGTTGIAQKVLYQRALEGELVRLITRIKIIDRAEVRIALPEKSVFLDENLRPKASVVISVATGQRLSQKGVNTIISLVAGAIPEMLIDDVQVADDNNNLLSKGLTDPDGSEVRDKNYSFQLFREKELEKKLVTQLEKIIGKDHVEAKVSLLLDFDSSEIIEDLVDPDLTAITSEEVTSEDSTGSRSIPIGVPGVTSNSPEVRAGASEIANISNVNKKLKRTNYVTSKRHIVRRKAAGEVMRMSVSVIVDGLREYTRNDDGEVVGSKYVPWSASDLLAMEQITKETVGFSSDRGDTITVQNFKFQKPLLEQEKLRLQKNEATRKFIVDLSKYIIVGLCVVLMVFVVIRPMVAKLSAKPEDLDLLMGLPTTIGELEGEELEIPTEKETGIPPRDKIIEIAKQDPLKTASLVRTWLREKKGP